ncbi:ABC transporter substrate-binding protein [Alcaligenes aquatilis]|uniref:ABC transporter substrate-binding protein n=1 Tax=Alcaligenes aquatilis TaxID=323284 RepID=UPI00320AFBC4
MFFRYLAPSLLALSVSFSAQAAEQALEIGYLPIMPAAQLFVGLGSGDLLPQGQPEPKLVQFQSGPALTQALIAGQLDVAYVGIGPALVARAKEADVKVVASNIVEQVSVVAIGDLAAYLDADKPDFAAAVAKFTQEKGHKPKVASYPKGAVPEAALQYWLRNMLKVDPDVVEVVYQGEAQIQQALSNHAVDAAAILEPTVSQILQRQPDAKIVAHGSQLFPNEPGSVLLVREGLIKSHPDLVQHLVNAHLRATAMLRDEPAKATPYVQKYVGGGRLPKDIVQAAIERSRDQFQPDPHKIIDGTVQLQDFQVSLGTLATKLDDVQSLFDVRFYEKAAP